MYANEAEAKKKKKKNGKTEKTTAVDVWIFSTTKKSQVRHVHPTAEAPAPLTTTTKSEIVENKMQQIEQQACLIDWMNFKNKNKKDNHYRVGVFIYLTIILKTFRIIKQEQQKQQYLPLLSSL